MIFIKIGYKKQTESLPEVKFVKKSLGSEASSSKSINSSVEYALAAAHPNTTMAHTLENIFTDIRVLNLVS